MNLCHRCLSSSEHMDQLIGLENSAYDICTSIIKYELANDYLGIAFCSIQFFSIG